MSGVMVTIDLLRARPSVTNISIYKVICPNYKGKSWSDPDVQKLRALEMKKIKDKGKIEINMQQTQASS